MKAVVYAVRLADAGWQWRVTLDWRVDRAYWTERGVAPENGVVRLAPALSLGQALWVRDGLEQEKRQAARMALAAGKRDDVGREIVNRLAALGAPQELLQRLQLEAGWSREEAAEEAAAGASAAGAVRQGERGGAGASAARRGDAMRGDGADRPREAEVLGRLLAGRMLLKDELVQMLAGSTLTGLTDEWPGLVQAAYLRGGIELLGGVACKERRRLWRRGRTYRCRRCGSGGERLQMAAMCADCGGPCPYCEECLQMGRSRFCSLLVRAAATRELPAARSGAAGWVAPPAEAELRERLRRWRLSPAQTEASLAGLRFLRGDGQERMLRRGRAADAGEPLAFLYWAVTGAGKTEMIFPLIEDELLRGGRVLVATPRRDVVLELAPRVAAAFPQRALVTLYGGSQQRWERGEVTLATTHQLMRFWRGFDLVILDEIDAFPFHNSLVLEHAARQACKPGGRFVLLSATPPKPLQAAAAAGRIGCAKVPVRFHRHPLPVPRHLRAAPVERWLQAGRLPQPLVDKLRQSLDRGAQLFLFVPRIKLAAPLVELLRRTFPGFAIHGTSSQDDERADKVMSFRHTDTRVLVTTTILERGVTVPKSDVFVLGADSRLFDEAALVQMAGRAGRSKDDPAGNVWLVSPERTAAQQGAIRQIVRMNRLARRSGYLLGEGGDRL
ncbi:helicase-related protein [Paenibacillus cymbidii]|uniref:helicase-related protein n=1 Tax=Paenibacillus cymbidii TaxID=1639034 RepID=UPI001080F131|nr:helicase-related protein [Paenibacillus cymbidii]